MSTYAIIQTGGKQYRVAPGQQITVEKLPGERGAEVVFEDVLLVGGEAGVQVGTPNVAGARVVGTVVEQTRDKKILVHHYRRRKNSRKTQGHRQFITRVRIQSVAV
jgi:large subunit ribosomal protein L21